MALWLKNGDYVPEGAGGFAAVQGEEALMQRVLFRLCARRGSFPMLPSLGSRLYLLGKEKPSARPAAARAWAEEALAEEDVSVEQAALEETGEGRLLVRLTLRREEQEMEVTVGV